MFVTADQLVAHAVGDYILQSQWMAAEKVRQSVAAAVHALVYSLTFLVFSPSAAAFAVIAGTHFVIDRWRLARYVVWAKNWLAPWPVCSGIDAQFKASGSVVGSQAHAACREGFQDHSRHRVVPNPPWSECTATGYPSDIPPWLATWLLIIADNVAHVICNALALRYL